MKKYRLKKGQAEFEAVDGPMAGRRFLTGVEYQECDIPPGDKMQFEKIPELAATKKENKGSSK